MPKEVCATESAEGDNALNQSSGHLSVGVLAQASPAARPKQAFARRNRILARPHFLRCYDTGKRLFSANFILFVLKRPQAEKIDAATKTWAVCTNWRLGLAVSRKTGSATVRNRVKRLLREVFRQNQALLPADYDIVVVPKKKLVPKSLTFHSLQAELLPLFASLGGAQQARTKGKPL